MIATFRACAIGALLVLALVVHSAPVQDSVNGLHRRDPALQNSPSYAPRRLMCPADVRVRDTAEGLHPGESAFVRDKTAKARDKWARYLSRAGLQGFDAREFLDKSFAAGSLPNIGIAVSGGGLRSLLHGAGILNAFDERIGDARNAGTGGILQLANYISGLSGGSWLVGSWATANFPLMWEMVGGVWRLSDHWAAPRHDTPHQFNYVYTDVSGKQAAGFPVSAVDLYARIISHHLHGDKMRGTRTLFSSIRDVARHQNHEFPYPIIVASSRASPTAPVTLNDPIYEFTPHSFGSFGPTLRASIPIDYMGTPMRGGRPMKDCVVGFENAAFIMGTSANIFPEATGQPFLQQLRAVPPFAALLAKTAPDAVDDAIVPNAFQGLLGPQTRQDHLYLADGGLGGEYTPYWPLQQPERHVDVIIGLDAIGDDANNYPNGTSLYTTFVKSLADSNGPRFPLVPEVDEFVEEKLHQRPSFFGCEDFSAPLVVYFPNYAATSFTPTNTPLDKLAYSQEEIAGFFTNSHAIATQPSNKRWSACLACALVDRQVYRNGQRRTSQCKGCFREFCRQGYRR